MTRAGQNQGARPVPTSKLAVKGRRGRPGRPRIPVDIDRARELRDQGLSYRQIAKAVGSTPGTVRRRLAQPLDDNYLQGASSAVRPGPEDDQVCCPTCGRPWVSQGGS